MSEMELSVFRQRSVEAMRQKARRGELFLTVAVGYVKSDSDRIEIRFGAVSRGRPIFAAQCKLSVTETILGNSRRSAYGARLRRSTATKSGR